ncbi:MAG: gliding motility-associated C-terminal domain-containing protein, partial [Sphingobacteriaceae bacterium]|nr:gliding motility-associated C-terminal domain-containing protein [Cytophagaceae bacterium]
PFLVTKPGQYWVTATTPCRTVSDTVNVAYALAFDLGADTTLCEGKTLKLNTPADAQSVRWQDGSTQSGYTVQQAGTYRVRVEQPDCRVEDSLRVRYIRPPQLELGPDRALCVGESFTLKPVVAEGTFAWDDPFPDQERTLRRTGTFRASVRNECATARDSVRVQQGACGCILHVPDVFTPNADGLNETFGPVAGCAEITLLSLAVFNRWGEVLFQTNAPPFEWDGMSRGTRCPEAAYAWEIGYQLTEGGAVRTERKQGAVRLVR